MALKKAPEARIRELLGVLNYLAAPFGTTEALLLKYGVQDIDFKYDDKNNPVPTSKGIEDLYVPWRSVAAMPDVLYDPNSSEWAMAAQPELTQMFAIGIKNAAAGLYSNTNAQKGGVLDQAVTDGVNAIIFGKAPLSSFDGLVATWKSGGGDQIRAEFEQAFQAANK